ncbi:AMP-binding protein [Aggregatibacter actinomycetemcomitans]|uniref:AMP-binding protein n=1 Tax=Aggregatibacter actinomycetemcomitans TaxID=714 RepID=UPI000D6DEEC3|nr:class I adenylate-forming enzyme family protein [Aggregatibacter actinomycetemcomitans]
MINNLHFFNIPDLWHDQGDETALIARNPDWQWVDFRTRARQIAEQLTQDNVKSVAFWFDDAALFACAMLACFHAGVRILLPPNLLAENQQWSKENADFLLDDALFAEYGITQHASQKHPAKRPHFTSHQQTEIWLKTSGSSGQPKILVKTAAQMWLESEAIRQSLPFSADNDIHLVSSVSAQHHYGLSYRIILPLTMGWSIARKQLPYPEYLIEESLLAPKTVWISSPALLTRLNLADTKLKQCAFAGVISSGGVLPADVGNAIRERLGVKLIECYGSTETGAIAFRADDGLWQPTPLTTVGLNEEGALWVESEWFNQREQTADAAELIDGKFNLLGRLDRIVKFGDKRISLVKIEQDLLRHPWVTDCYVAQHPQHLRPAAWVALNEAGIAAYRQQERHEFVNELRAFLMQTQERAGLPRFWRFTTELPRNSQSKLSKEAFYQVFLTEKEEHF